MRAVPFIERPIEGLAPCYLLKGSDGCIIRAVADKILSMLPPDEREINYDEFGDDTAIADVLAALETVSLTGGKRVVFLRRRSRAMTDEEKKDFAAYCAVPNLDSVLIVEDTPQMYGRLKQYMFEIDCSPATASEIKDTALAEIGARNCTISAGALAKLVDYCNLNYGRVAVEVAKLCDYADGAKIDEAAVEALVTPDADYKGYLLASYFDEGKTDAALGILSGMRSKGDAAAKILAIITSSYRKILHCAISSLGDGELAAALGASEASIRVTRSNIRERKRSVSGYVVKLKDKTEYLYELEYKFKSGLISDENALRLAVGKLAADAR